MYKQNILIYEQNSSKVGAQHAGCILCFTFIVPDIIIFFYLSVYKWYDDGLPASSTTFSKDIFYYAENMYIGPQHVGIRSIEMCKVNSFCSISGFNFVASVRSCIFFCQRCDASYSCSLCHNMIVMTENYAISLKKIVVATLADIMMWNVEEKNCSLYSVGYFVV